MKLFLIVLLSVLSYHCCSGYSVVEGELSKDLENATSTESWLETSNDIASNDSSPLEMHGNKVVEKVKEGIKTVKDKLKDGLDKVKDKIKDFKDKIGSKGGSGGGSGGRDKYDRDYDRDEKEKNRNNGGVGWSNSNEEWVVVVIVVFILVAGLGFLAFLKIKEIRERRINSETIKTKE